MENTELYFSLFFISCAENFLVFCKLYLIKYFKCHIT